MLLLIGQLIYIFAILLGAGFLVRRFLFNDGEMLGQSTSIQYRFVKRINDMLVYGIILISTFSAWLSLFHPINGNVHVAMAVPLLIIGSHFIIKNIKISIALFSTPIVIPLLLASAWALLLASGPCLLWDTGMYHMQTIKWMKEYGVVPGLANLYSNLGFNSLWHSFLAVFDHGLTNELSSHVGGLIIFVLFLFLALEGLLQYKENNKSTLAIFKALGAFVVALSFSNHITSQSPDFPAAFMIYLIASRFLDHYENGLPDLRALLMQMSLLCVFAVAVKLSAFPIILILGIVMLKQLAKVRRIAMAGMICLSIVGSYMARCYVTSGYIAFPQTIIDIANPDWKVPNDDNVRLQKAVKYWAFHPQAWYNYDPNINLVAKYKLWYNQWFTDKGPEWNTKPNYYILFSLFLGVVVFAQSIINHRGDRSGSLKVLSVLLGGTVFVMFTAPEPRFISIWALPLGTYAVSRLIQWLVINIKYGNTLALAVIILIGIERFLYANKEMGLLTQIQTRNIFSRLVDIERPTVPAYSKLRIHGGWINYFESESNDNRTYYGPLPIVCGTPTNLSFRGLCIGDGFKIKIQNEVKTSNNRRGDGIEALPDK